MRNPQTNDSLVDDINRILTDQVPAMKESGATDFFAAGGDSIAAVQVLERIAQELGITVTLEAFFDNPTVQGIVTAGVAMPAAGAQGHVDVLDGLSDEELLALLDEAE